MKKLALLTSLLLCLGSFAACGDTDGDGSNKKSSSSSAPSYDLNDDDSEGTDKDDEPETEELTEEPSTEEPTEADDEVTYMRGRVENGSYIAPSAGFAFDADSDWTFASEEEILQMMGLASDYSDSGDMLEKLIAEQAVIYDAHAIQNGGTKNIIFMFENVRKEGADPDMLSSEAFLDILKMNLNSSGSMEYKDFSDIKSFDLSGDEYKYFTVSASSALSGDIFQTYACKKVGDYFFGIIYTSVQDDFNGIISKFRAAE